ncbi:hypothetical protein N7532_004586 [Penicillium argentinense]|uniref:Uncharacterized protein n=1 Tax=Penicillium argentinense TaxID=1131581 RepID=A0A9W9KGA3_9EURO|nr:uncharacterized protein N7532_004586 [Penicillium argentinense]KAJ5104057.1 hypothetical protein N7532_004586 [Penicillium argentinense]
MLRGQSERNKNTSARNFDKGHLPSGTHGELDRIERLEQRGPATSGGLCAFGQSGQPSNAEE